MKKYLRKKPIFLILIILVLIWPSQVLGANLFSSTATVVWGNNKVTDLGYLFTNDEFQPSPPEEFHLINNSFDQAGDEDKGKGCDTKSGGFINVDKGLGSSGPYKFNYFQLKNPPLNDKTDPSLLWGAAKVQWGSYTSKETNCDYDYLYNAISVAPGQDLAFAEIDGDVYAKGSIDNIDELNPNKPPYLAILGDHLVVSEGEISGLEGGQIIQLGAYQLSGSNKIDIDGFKKLMNKYAIESAQTFTNSGNLITALNNGTVHAKNPKGDIYVFDGNLIINQAVTVPKNSKKTLIVKNGNVDIQYSIGRTDSGTSDGSLMIVALDGDITISGRQVNPNAPIAYWQMNESDWINDCSAATVIDSTQAYHGQSCPGRNGNGPIEVQAQNNFGGNNFGNAGQFDGLDDYLISPSLSLALNLKKSAPPSFTISAWFNPSSLATQGQNDYGGIALSNQNYPRLSYQPQQRRQPAKFVFQLKSNKAISTDATPDTWHHVAGVYNSSSSRIEIYLDGSLKSPRNLNSIDKDLSTAITDTLIKIGKTPKFYKGQIDEVRVYNRALTSSEIAQDMKPGLTAGAQSIDANIINAGLISLKQDPNNSDWTGQVSINHAGANCASPNICQTAYVRGLLIGGKISFNRNPVNIVDGTYGAIISYDKKLTKLPGLDQLVNPIINEKSP